MTSEIIEEEEYGEEHSVMITSESQKERISKIIQYQKSLYLSSSAAAAASSLSSLSSSSAASNTSSFSSSQRSCSLLALMKGGSTSLRRLFDMEHTSLANYFEEYSGSPVIKPIPLWGSDTDDGHYDPWESIKRSVPSINDIDDRSKAVSEGDSKDKRLKFQHKKIRTKGRSKLSRTKSFRRLPGFGLWIARGFRFRLRLRRLRIMICGRKF